MKLAPLHRTIQLRADQVNAATRSVEFSFSSETPVDRFFGSEILDHGAESVRLGRINSGAPLLFNHKMDDVIGVIERAEIRSDKRGYATARFAKTARADEVLGMVNDGVLRNVSFMYRIHEIVEKPKSEEYRAVDWEPMEISLVSVPADYSVGIGREHGNDEQEVRIRSSEVLPAQPATSQGAQMSEVTAAAGASAATTDVVVTVDNERGAKLEKARASALSQMGEKYKIDAGVVRGWIDNDISINAAGDEIVKVLEKRSKDDIKSVAQLGMSRNEVEGYSLFRAINACADKNWSKAGLELEAHQAIAHRLNTIPDPNKFYVPLEVQHRPAPNQNLAMQRMLQYMPGTAQRDLLVATGSAGGFLVQTTNEGFIDMLRNVSVCFRMGARRMGGLQGNVMVPKQTGAATVSWLATEATAITESQQVFAQLALSPKNVGAYTEISRQLTLQASPDAESIVTADLAATVALAVDLAGIAGSGAAGQPTGIINTGGIGGVVGTTIAFAGILEFQTDVASANVAPVRGGYVTTPVVAALLIGRVKYASTASPLWEGSVWEGSVQGFPALSSLQIPTGNILFGDWDKLVIAEWGVLEVEVNPYANFQAGIIGVRAIYTVDVGVRIPLAFSLATAVT